MIISTIKLYQNNDGLYSVVIWHDGKKVESGNHRNAGAAYAEAESRLVYKPGFVRTIPRSEM